MAPCDSEFILCSHVTTMDAWRATNGYFQHSPVVPGLSSIKSVSELAAKLWTD